MKKTLLILIILCFNQIFSQHHYTDLKYVEIKSSYLNGTFGYPDSEKFELINNDCTELNNCYNYDDPLVHIGKWKLENEKCIEFYYTESPSDDPTFVCVYDNEIILEESGTTFHFKENKTAYIEGNANSYFDKKRKFKFKNNIFTEIIQPFYYIGMKGKLNFPIKLYETESFKNKVVVLPKDYEIEIILGKTGGKYNDLEKILIKSEFGLIGWFNFKEVAFGKPIIDELYYHGD